ncbi:MAG: nucleotide-binding protein [Treponema sp.]|jgi:predicted nucleotide-binding protein|nr:nucleotide-binding protein [Treponema sp.]
MRERLERLIERAESIRNSSSNSPEFKAWKTDVLRFLINQYGKVSIEVTSFENLQFYSIYLRNNPDKIIERFQHGLETAILYLKNYLSDSDVQTEQTQKQIPENNENVFIVHGRDEGVKAQVSNLVQKMKLKPIILHEHANKGQTVIEKFEKHADVKAALVLFTGDDIGKYKDDDKDEKRPRQNVIFEAGYFMGKLGRKNTIILAEEGLNIQSDLQGYIYIPLDEHRRWHFDLARELKAIGFDIDMNTLV